MTTFLEKNLCSYCFEIIKENYVSNSTNYFCDNVCSQKYKGSQPDWDTWLETRVCIMEGKIWEFFRENEELKKRVIQLECEPYRGPEFYEVLKEEKASGLLS